MKTSAMGLAAAALILCAALAPSRSVAADAAAAPDLGPETAAMDRGDFKEALRLALPLAEKGDAQAEHILGVMYAQGWGVPQDFAAAAAWYEKAADQGLEASENNLGNLYMDGAGVAKDYAKAAYWYRKAADQGALQADFNLGILYESGQGVPQDYKQAAELYRKVAEAALSALESANSPHP